MIFRILELTTQMLLRYWNVSHIKNVPQFQVISVKYRIKIYLNFYIQRMITFVRHAKIQLTGAVIILENTAHINAAIILRI
jgi:hypothetical protein